MDDDSEFPMIRFSCVGFLPEEGAKAAIERGEKAEWKLNVVSRPAISGPVPNLALPGQQVQGGNGEGQATQAEAPVSPANGVVEQKPAKNANMDEILKGW